MAELNIETAIKSGVEKALNEPFAGGKSIAEWVAIGMNAPRWINVEDRLPEKNGVYLAYYDRTCVSSVYYEKGRAQSEWTDDYEGYCDFDVTHWMPLPEPPKEVQE